MGEQEAGRGSTVLAELRDTKTGETRTYEQDLGFRYDSPDRARFIWSEGNFSCDCNRALFFARAAGEEDPNINCGDRRYALDSLIVDGVELIESDELWSWFNEGRPTTNPEDPTP